jgi:hypothetical protein
MTSHTGALVAAPSWGGATADAAAFVLGSSLALWAAALAAMW